MNPFKDCVTYWEVAGSDGFGGVTFKAPVLLDARWEDRNDQFVDQSGKIAVSKAVIFFPTGTEVVLGGYLAQGDNSEESSPADVTGAFEIRGLARTPDLRRVRDEIRAIL